MSKTLKPCPFCGGEPVAYETEFGLTVRCKGDDHEAATFGDYAVDAWNARYEYPCRNLSSESHRFHCSECDTIVGHAVNYCPTCGSEVRDE